MTNKLKNYLKLRILILVVFISFTNCQKDDNQLPLENVLDTNLNRQVEWLGFNELPDKVLQVLPVGISSKTSSTKAELSYSSRFTNDSILRAIDSLGNQRYSFKLNQPQTPSKDIFFDNYIVAIDTAQTVLKYVIRYLPEKEWLSTYESDSDFVRFTGKVVFYREDGTMFWETNLTQGKTSNAISNKSTNNQKISSSKQIMQDVFVHITYEDCTCHEEHAAGGCTHPIKVFNISYGGSGPDYYGGGSDEENDTSDPSYGGGSSTPINSPTLKESYIMYIDECLYSPTSLSPFLNGLTIDKLRDLKNYLSNNSCSNEAKDFTALALEAWDNDGIDDGEVDFDDNIIYDNSLNNFPCQKLVIEEATGTCSPLTQLILDIFEANDGTNLIFKSSSTLSNVNANTSSTSNYNATTHTCDITITFRESYLQTATDLAIARTAIHESLHATLVYMFEENLLQSANGTPMDGFEDFVEAYVNHLSGLPVNLNKAHHELMADFVEDIASSLSAYGVSNGYSNSFDFYKKLSWSGDILKTPTYQSLYPEYLNPTDATTNPSNINPAHLEIVNTSAAEENNATYTYPHPNGTTYTNAPKGNKPNTSEPCN